MNLTTKILWALVQNDGNLAQAEFIKRRGLRHTETVVRHLITRFEDWYSEAGPLEAEIAKEGLTGDFVDEFFLVLQKTKILVPQFRQIRKAMDEFDAGKCKLVNDIFENVDE